MFRSTCSWSIDSQWFKPFVKAFCENNSLDNILLHWCYVLVLRCWARRRHVIGGENRAVTRSPIPCIRRILSDCRPDWRRSKIKYRCQRTLFIKLYLVSRLHRINYRPSYLQITCRSKTGSSKADTNQPTARSLKPTESADRSDSDQPKTFL